MTTIVTKTAKDEFFRENVWSICLLLLLLERARALKGKGAWGLLERARELLIYLLILPIFMKNQLLFDVIAPFLMIG